MTLLGHTLAHNAPRLVWALAGLGVAGCVLCLAVLTGVFARVDRLQDNNAALARHAEAMSGAFGRFAFDTHNHLSELLDLESPDDSAADRALEGERSAVLAMLGDLEAHGPEAAAIADRFRTLDAREHALHAGLVAWADRSRRNRALTELALAETLGTIGQVRAALSTEQGRARLQRLGEVRAYRAAKGEEAARLAATLLSPAREATAGAGIETELSDLSLYAQQLAGENQAERVALLKENSVRPALGRLSQELARSAGLDAGHAAIPKLEALLVGEHGLVAAALERASLHAESRPLERGVDTLTSELRAAADMVTAFLAETQARSAEHITATVAAARTATFLLLAGLAAATVLVGRRISASILSQARGIQDANTRLDQALSESRAANRAKTDFLANMSHEIRTPMTAILGFAELLADPATEPSDRDAHIATIQRQGRHLLSIINDILDLSKVESGSLTVERLPTPPLAAAEEVVGLFRAQAREKGIDLSTSNDWPLPASFPSDPLRLRQVLINLVGNAVKFTERGSVTLHLAYDPEPRTLAFHVRDTGLGLSKPQIARLFQPFTQADETMSRRFGGTGIGLFLSKRLAESLGGTISVESEPGRGSTFTLRFPLAADPELLHRPPARKPEPASPAGGSPNARPAGPASATPLANRRILLAEDGPDNQRLIRHHLSRAGATVRIAPNGRTAVELARAEPYDLVLMDMQMPEMDGYTATAILRGEGYRQPIIALTAHAMTGDRERCLAAGCTDYLSKPVERAQLISACLRHTAAPGTPAPTSA